VLFSIFLNQTEDELSRASLAAESFYPLDISESNDVPLLLKNL
jgi:hypothetical protein